MTASLATHTGAARRGWQTETGTEFTFKDIAELCAFLQHEIQSSKRKYKKIAEMAGCCPATVSNMASGTTIYPRAGTVFAMLRVLGYEVVIRA
jgi:hypothetical protein